MSLETSSLLLCLKAVNLAAVAGWMAGQLCLWRLHVHRTTGATHVLGGLDRRVLQGVTTAAAIVSLSSGAGLLVL